MNFCTDYCQQQCYYYYSVKPKSQMTLMRESIHPKGVFLWVWGFFFLSLVVKHVLKGKDLRLPSWKALMNVFCSCKNALIIIPFIQHRGDFFIMLSCVSYSCSLLLMSACLVCVKWIDMDSVIDLQLVKQLTCPRPFSCNVILRNNNIKHQEGRSIKITLSSRHMHIGWE